LDFHSFLLLDALTRLADGEVVLERELHQGFQVERIGQRRLRRGRSGRKRDGQPEGGKRG